MHIKWGASKDTLLLLGVLVQVEFFKVKVYIINVG